MYLFLIVFFVSSSGFLRNLYQENENLVLKKVLNTIFVPIDFTKHTQSDFYIRTPNECISIRKYTCFKQFKRIILKANIRSCPFYRYK